MWKRIYYGCYEVNKSGKVRRVKPAKGTRKGKVLKPYGDCDAITLCNGDKQLQLTKMQLINRYCK